MASALGSLNINSSDNRMIILLVSLISLIESALNTKPKKSDPQSPIKAFAGGIFLGRNPRIEKRSIRETKDTSKHPKIRAITAMQSACEDAIPLAKPSRPSQRLVALVIKIIQPSANRVKNASLMLFCLGNKIKIYSILDRACPNSFVNGEMLIASSSSPTKNIDVPPVKIAILKFTSMGKRVKERKNATKNVIPPSRAVGYECSFLSLGTSIALSDFANLIEGVNNIYETIDDASANENPIKNIRTPLIYVSKGFCYVILN